MGFVFASTVVRRLLGSLPLLVVVSMMIFVILRLIPADPLAMMLPPNATDADMARLMAAYGLDQPLIDQYLIWLRNAVTGNLGESIQLRQSVTGLIASALPATLELVAFGLALGLFIGIGMGLVMFAMRRRRGEFVGEVVSIGILSIPEFLWAIILLLVFGVTYSILPFIGRLEPGSSVDSVTGFLLLDTLITGRPDLFVDALAHLLLPALALGLAFSPLIMRVVRSSLIEVEREDYVSMAHLRGLSSARILFNYLLRNAALPTVSLIGVQTAFLFGGTLLIEVIYSYPGIGNLMVEAVRTQDLPLIQGITVTYCAVVLLINAVVDASYTVLNPKLRTTGS